MPLLPLAHDLHRRHVSQPHPTSTKIDSGLLGSQATIVSPQHDLRCHDSEGCVWSWLGRQLLVRIDWKLVDALMLG
jgi:hypothetical protein